MAYSLFKDGSGRKSPEGDSVISDDGFFERKKIDLSKDLGEIIKEKMKAAAVKIRKFFKHAIGKRPSVKEIKNQLTEASKVTKTHKDELKKIKQKIDEFHSKIEYLNKIQENTNKCLKLINTIKTSYLSIKTHYNSSKITDVNIEAAINNLINTAIDARQELDADTDRDTMQKIDEYIKKLNDKKIEISQSNNLYEALKVLNDSEDFSKSMEETEDQIKSMIEGQDRYIIESAPKEIQDLIQKRNQLEKYVYNKPEISNLLENQEITQKDKSLLEDIQESIIDKEG